MDPAEAAVQALCRARSNKRGEGDAAANPGHATLLGGPGKSTSAHSRRFVCTHCYGKDGVGALTRQEKALAHLRILLGDPFTQQLLPSSGCPTCWGAEKAKSVASDVC